MDYSHKQSVAWAQFEAFRSHPPIWWDEAGVGQFHGIVTALEDAYAVDLSSFRIPAAEVKPRVVGVSRIPRSGRFPARTQMSDKRYCNEQFALRQVEGIVFYFQNLQPSPEPKKVGFLGG